MRRKRAAAPREPDGVSGLALMRGVGGGADAGRAHGGEEAPAEGGLVSAAGALLGDTQRASEGVQVPPCRPLRGAAVSRSCVGHTFDKSHLVLSLPGCVSPRQVSALIRVVFVRRSSLRPRRAEAGPDGWTRQARQGAMPHSKRIS